MRGAGRAGGARHGVSHPRPCSPCPANPPRGHRGCQALGLGPASPHREGRLRADGGGGIAEQEEARHRGTGGCRAALQIGSGLGGLLGQGSPPPLFPAADCGFLSVPLASQLPRAHQRQQGASPGPYGGQEQPLGPLVSRLQTGSTTAVCLSSGRCGQQVAPPSLGYLKRGATLSAGPHLLRGQQDCSPAFTPQSEIRPENTVIMETWACFLEGDTLEAGRRHCSDDFCFV